MAKSEKRLELMKENIAANALIAGICPVIAHIYVKRTNKKMVNKKKINPRK